ncbi:fas-binding factor 1 [Cephus cinctus]|uniref:Fas-binding factor 1 n=1 Tax=Cephus cinctus TaxID=211228 RepID=A0AAJ7BV93_CEPCN|nr:fas-binding factor 1 [Cephus cinctus]
MTSGRGFNIAMMADLSDKSDVDPEELAKMVEDMDDLDNDLFGSTLSKPKSGTSIQSKEPDNQILSGAKKRVVFRDFNEDDPLADLLSDEETFQQKSKQAVSKPKGSKMADLFGLKNTNPTEHVKSPIKQSTISSFSKSEETKPKTFTRDPDWLGIMDETPSYHQESNIQKVVQNPKTVFDSKNDVVAELPDRPTSTSEKIKKSSLMEDLFGNKPRTTPSKELNPRKDPIRPGIETPVTQPRQEAAKIESKSLGIGYAPTVSAPREPRRGRRGSGVINDPLGILSLSSTHVEQPPPNATEDDTPKNNQLSLLKEKENILTLSEKGTKAVSKDSLPEWLGGPKKSKEEKLEGEKQTFLSNANQKDDLPKVSQPVENSTLSQDIQSVQEPVLIQQSSLDYDKINYPEHMSLLMGTQFDQQAAIMSMQQQEHELRIATTLSRQNEQLSQLLESQKNRLNEQERQFNMLIKKQIDRQILLETQMKIQQERINNHIQTLMAQPNSVPMTFVVNKNLNNGMNEEPKNKEEESESLVHKLQMEKLYLENTLETLKETHDREITIIEESYKKQITIMQEAVEKLEIRMRHDSEVMEADYEAKIEKLKEEKRNLESVYTEEIEKLKKEHEGSLRDIHERHRRSVILLEKEHAETIESINKAKELERQAIGTTKSYSTDLTAVLDKAQSAIEGIQSLHDKIQDKNIETEETRKNYLNKQVEHLELLKKQVEKHENTLNAERSQLMEAAQKMEIGAIRMISEFQKRSIENNEAEERLKSREQSLVRDRELFNEQVQWERSYLQVIKETWLKEQERQNKLIAQEREAIASEKAKLEVTSRLKIGSDDTAKAEIEAALKAAQDAAANANQERQKWRERVSELESQRQILREKESQLVLRAKELEDLTQSALEKREEGLRALREARRIENQNKEKAAQWQLQIEALAQRENKLATDKLALARERLAIRVNQAERPEKDVERSGTSYKHVDESYLSALSHNTQVSTHFKDVVDPHLILLKLNLDNKLETGNEYLSVMNSVNR